MIGIGTQLWSNSSRTKPASSTVSLFHFDTYLPMHLFWCCLAACFSARHSCVHCRSAAPATSAAAPAASAPSTAAAAPSSVAPAAAAAAPAAAAPAAAAPAAAAPAAAAPAAAAASSGDPYASAASNLATGDSLKQSIDGVWAFCEYHTCTHSFPVSTKMHSKSKSWCN